MRTLAILFALYSLTGCKDYGIEVPPDIPIAQLLQAPDTISADGKWLYLTTEMWRDFMPFSPPDGKPLIAIIYVTTADSTQIPSSISTELFGLCTTIKPGGHSSLGN